MNVENKFYQGRKRTQRETKEKKIFFFLNLGKKIFFLLIIKKKLLFIL